MSALRCITRRRLGYLNLFDFGAILFVVAGVLPLFKISIALWLLVTVVSTFVLAIVSTALEGIAA